MKAARSAEDWRSFLSDHMPPGEDALDLLEGSLFYRHFKALAIEIARFDALVDDLLDELDPRATGLLITEWERYLELPRDCQTPFDTLSERRAALSEVITRGADISAATIIDAAALFGFTITIKEFFPESVPADLPLSNAFRYEISGVTGTEFVLFRAGQSVSGDPLGKDASLDLECLLDEIEPAYAERTIL